MYFAPPFAVQVGAPTGVPFILRSVYWLFSTIFDETNFQELLFNNNTHENVVIGISSNILIEDFFT